MKQLYKYMINRFIGPFFMTFFITVFVLLMQFLWTYLDEFVGKGLDGEVIAELMLYAISSLIPLALPLSMLLASIMTFGNLGENNELLAMKAAGISLTRIMRPLIFLSVFVSLFAFYFANDIMPVTNRKFAALLLSIRYQKPELIVKDGVFSNEIDGYSIKVGRKSKKTDKLYNIMIYDHTKNEGNTSVTVADSGVMKMSEDKKFMVLTLFSGEAYTDQEPNSRRRNNEYPFRRDKFSKEVLITPIKGMDFKRKDESSVGNFYKALSLRQLSSSADSMAKDLDKRRTDFSVKLNYLPPLTREVVSYARTDSSVTSRLKMDEYVDVDSMLNHMNRNVKMDIVSQALRNARSNKRSLQQAKDDLDLRTKWLNKYWVEWHRKFTLSLACLIFFFIGAPLGAIIRKGGLGMPLVISIVLFIFYYIISMTGEKMSREGVGHIWEGMWFSSLLFLPAGIFLTYKAANDSVILNINAYAEIFRKLNPFKKKKKKDDGEEPKQHENPLAGQ
ncbi:LptF/LptG family permease [Prolixibacter sp. SD074]|uniref:LptF/LptG family permease n=1 Tax=Prolixibacter sp. SD074 TaxID=2652391 RepID=UPI001298F0E9|nr:LptF/LptG family permease [Prolixibacter sp. SD074]